MNLICESNSLDDYLVETEDVNHSHYLIKNKAKELYSQSLDEIGFIKSAFEFVRDFIPHSWDIQSSRITCSASEVLFYQEGICYAKSNLLCALLRCQGIPTGFCYQRLTLGDTPDTGYVIHALNAVYLRSIGKWIRLDARGNKAGVDAQFSLEEEKLAFPIREVYEEQDYPVIYKTPNKKTTAVLLQNTDCKMMYLHGLPSEL
ncbi:transglutaminase-like domain-containing protein [Paenibacillus eucommiae]|uniref:Transglutaminase-like putative cysteine protease n=1 Tax=Paenibacillus eucommiae TaxID=1355755 RepID=A0ABS4IMI4_9BACL|nr:transglutaminase family protein [Paenibacillus eucommiae]MBP1988776.1 transglutaminase-like putative cysteine protease [Paenibacillus eucommiae]